MRAPNKPPEFDVMTSFDDSLGVVVCDWLNIHQPIIVETLVEAFVETVVISLRVECYCCTFIKFSRLRLMNFDVLQDKQVLKQLLKISFADLKVQIAENALRNIAGLHHLGHGSSSSQSYTGASQIVNDFIAL